MDMSYDCSNSGYYSYDFGYFDVTFGGNTPPNAPSAPSGPASGTPGSSYSYSATATDPNGDQVKYTFDWGDGTPQSQTGLVNSGTSGSATHAWTAAGTYQVKAIATDSKGASSGWSSPLAVTIAAAVNKPPNAPSRPTGLASGKVGMLYGHSTYATDPDIDQVKYTFDWGDGTTTDTGLVNSDTRLSASHAWTEAGTYQVKAMATDSKGASSGWSAIQSVAIS